MRQDFAEASELGPLVRVNKAWCPSHGPITPEGLAFPFTVTGEALAFMADETYGCAARGCEDDLLVEAEPSNVRLVQHLVLVRPEDFPGDYEHDRYASTAEQWAAMGFKGPRVIIESAQVEPGIFAMGVALEQHGGADQVRAADRELVSGAV